MKNFSNLQEDLRKWFSKTDPAGDWKRINSKGEVAGPCAREPGESKPKCMSRAKRESLTKKERASAVRAKRKYDPDPERKGEPINVSNFGKGKISENMENLEEKNVPTNPSLWSQAKSLARSKFDVYPCVPLDSLAISKNGPISHDELDIGDEILTYNMNQDMLEWKPITYKHYYENAPLLEIGKPTGFSIRCTPNHKWVISKDSGNELVETKDLNTHMRILMCSTLKNDSSLLIEDWSKKDNWVEKILSMNEKEREIFLASSIVYDGWDKGLSSKIKDRHTFGFIQKEYDHLWASLLAAYLNGYYVNSRERMDDLTSATYIRNKRFHNTQNLYKKEVENEDVWCPTTENETWVMIQNGLITITGNSAYANGWASKWYKGKGGSWKSVSEETLSEAPPNTADAMKRYKAGKAGFTDIAHLKAKGLVARADGTKRKSISEESDKAKQPDYEYDQEGDMAKSDLRSIMANAKELHDMIDDADNLPEWCQNKITLAEDYISTVANYMTAEMSEGVMQEGRPSQRHPLEGHDYHKKTNAELVGIAKDAHKAAEAMKSHNTTAENKYRDQASDSATVRYFRQKNGMPEWYKKKYGHVKQGVTEGIQDEPHEIVHKETNKTVSTHKNFKDAYSAYQDLSKASDHAIGHIPKKTNEDVEPITELSSETLDSYKDKAKKSSNSLTSQGKYRQANDRTMNVMKATGKQIDKTVSNIRKSLNNDSTPAQRSLQPNNKTMVRESRRLEIVREAMVDAKKKDQKKKMENKLEMNGSDKFQAEPELSNQVIKNNV